MTTNWTRPGYTFQFAEDTAENDHISWTDVKNFPIITEKDLRHIARSPKPDLKNKTYYIGFNHFYFENLPTIISGIELKLTARRRGRIIDDTVQLMLDNNFLGDNKASLNVDPVIIYGGTNDKWGLVDIDTSVISNLNFGVTIRLQSHPKWPHKDSAIIDLVELRIH